MNNDTIPDAEKKQRREREVEATFASMSRPRFRCSGPSIFKGVQFVGKNAIALCAGLVLAMIIRVSLGAASISEPAIIRAKNGTELLLTDVLSGLFILLLCHYWMKPIRSHRERKCCDLKLLARTTLRDSIPLLFGLASMWLVKAIEVGTDTHDNTLRGPKDSRLLEKSDAIGSVVLLLSFHLIDCLLEWKWASDPYKEIPSPENAHDLSTIQGPMV